MMFIRVDQVTSEKDLQYQMLIYMFTFGIVLLEPSMHSINGQVG